MLKFFQAFAVLGCSALAIAAAALNLKATLENDSRHAAEAQQRAQRGAAGHHGQEPSPVH